MKKNLLLLALLTAVSFGFTACGGDKEDETSKPSNQTEQKYKDDAVKLEFNDANPIDYYVVDEETGRTDYTIKELELTESGYYFVKLEKKRNQEVKATRAGGSEIQIVWGMYTKREDGSFDLAGFGYVTIVGNGNSSAQVTINLVTGTENPNTTVTVTVTVTPPNNNYSQKNQNLCRAWDIISTRVQIEGVSGFYQEQGCNINSILDYIKNYSDVKDNLKPNTEIETIVFSDNGTFALLYKNSRTDKATWRWVNEQEGTLRYDWDFGDMGYSFIDGTASVTFGNPTQLKLFGTVDDGKGERKKVTATINIK
jgi:hypothetical protein